VKIDPSGNMTKLANIISPYALAMIGDKLVATRTAPEATNAKVINIDNGNTDAAGYSALTPGGYPNAFDIVADPFQDGKCYMLTSEPGGGSYLGVAIEYTDVPLVGERTSALGLTSYEKPRGLLAMKDKTVIFGDSNNNLYVTKIVSDGAIALPPSPITLSDMPISLLQDPITGQIFYSTSSGAILKVDLSTNQSTTFSLADSPTDSNNEGPFSTVKIPVNAMYFDHTNKRLLVTSQLSEVIAIEYGCPDGYTGELCTVPICYGIRHDDPLVCGGNGICAEPNTCQCNTGHNFSKTCLRLKQPIDAVTVTKKKIQRMIPSGSGTGSFYVCIDQGSSSYGITEVNYSFSENLINTIGVGSCGSMALYGESLFMVDENKIIMVNVTSGTTEVIAGQASPGAMDGFGSEAKFSAIQSLQVSRDGRFLWVLEFSGAFRKVSLFQNYKVTTQTPMINGSARHSYSFVIDLDNNIVFGDHLNNKIWKFNVDSVTPILVTDSIIYPCMLSLDPLTGDLFVGNDTHIIYYSNTTGVASIIAGVSGASDRNVDGFIMSTTTVETGIMVYDSYSDRLMFNSPEAFTIRAIQYSCPKGWSGQNCTIPLCNGKSTCNNGGTCIATDECKCLDGTIDKVRFCGSPDTYRGTVTEIVNGYNVTSATVDKDGGSLYFIDSNSRVLKYNFDGATPTTLETLSDLGGITCGYKDGQFIVFVTKGNGLEMINPGSSIYHYGNGSAGYSAGDEKTTHFTNPKFIATDPYDVDTIYVGTERAVFRVGLISKVSSLIIGDITKNDVELGYPLSSSIYNYTDFAVNPEGTFLFAHPQGVLFLSPYFNDQKMQKIDPSSLEPPHSFIVAAELGIIFLVYPKNVKSFNRLTYEIFSDINLSNDMSQNEVIKSGVYHPGRNTLILVLSGGKLIEVTLDGTPDVGTSPSNDQYSSPLDTSYAYPTYSPIEESSVAPEHTPLPWPISSPLPVPSPITSVIPSFPIEQSSVVPEHTLFPTSSPDPSHVQSAPIVESTQKVIESSPEHSSPGTFPALSMLPAMSDPPIIEESFPQPVESSPDNTPVITEYIPVTLGEHQTSDRCGAIALYADLKRLDVVDATYRWFISRDGVSEFVDQTINNGNVTAPFETKKPGQYLVYVLVDGTVNKHLLIKGNSTYTFIKRDNEYGPKCTYKISYTTSFGNLPEEGQRKVVSRSTKFYIKTFTDAPAGITYKWTAPLNRRSLQADSTNVMITDPIATGIALQFPSGDMEFIVTMEISMNNKPVFAKQLSFITSPSRPFDVPSNKYNGFQVTSDLVKDPKIKYDGTALKTLFTLSAIGWTKRYTEEFVYIFSYYDNTAKRFVPLATNSEGTVTTTLPVGYGSKHKLKLQLTVKNNWDDSQSVSQDVVIVSRSIQDDAIAISSISLKLITSSNETDFITGTIAVAAYINQNAYRITGATKAVFQGVINELLEHTSTLISNSTLGQMNETTLLQQIAVVDVLTKASTIISDQGKEKALDIMRNVISLAKADNGTTSTVTIGLSTYKEIAHVISNVVGGGFSNEQVATKTILTANEMARAILNQKLVTEEASSVVSDNFELVVKSDRAHAFDNSRIETTNSDTGSINVVQIPGNFAYDVVPEGSDVVSYTMLVFKKNPFQYAQAQQQRDIASSVVDLTFHHENGSAIAVRNLTAPLQLMISKPKRCDVLGERATFTCRYWDEEHNVWSTDGCYWVPEASTDSVVACHCNHTTSFSAFILHKGKCPEKTPGMSISGIVFNTAYIALCVPILIALFITRNTQPVRSRFIAPFVGIIAILVDSILQGWINNSLALAEQWSAMDAFSYVIMLTANPLAVSALFVFLWQQIRFVLFQNIYYLMGSSASLHKKIMILCRIITSKLIFCLTTLTIAGFVMCYFAALVAVAATRKTGIQTDRVITAQAVSFASFILVIALGIALMLMVDVFMSFRRSKETVSGDSGADVIQVNQKKGIAVIAKNLTDDALYFRFEACLILLAVLIMFILYPIGIASVVKESPAKSGLSIVRLLIEFIFMFVKIVSFGGFVCGIAVKNYLKPQEQNIMDRIQQEDPEMNVGDDKILSVLRNEAGYRMVSNYCRIEFSLENLLLWKELEELRANNLIMSTSERRAALQLIDELYIQRNSEREFNCGNSVKKMFHVALHSKEPSVVDTEEAFAALYGACMHNIADTFTRLTSTQPYNQFMKGREMEQELKSTVQ
jgi:hypothetical protein